MGKDFFNSETDNFFRPLTGKYREVALRCLQYLYRRLHGPEADYQSHVTIEDLQGLFLMALRDAPILEDDFDSVSFKDATSELAKVNEIKRLLIAFGWLDTYHDKSSMFTAYRFTRIGKTIIESIENHVSPDFKTRQRNVRNTRNSLEAYKENHDPYDLIDAVNSAKNVISDLSDDINDLNTRKQELTIKVSQNSDLAVDEFLDYMDKHFIPDIAIKISSDSVSRHRHKIIEIVHKINDWPEHVRQQAEVKLIRMIPDLEGRYANLIDYMLDRIVQMIDSACEVKMPEMRSALMSFTTRANLIIKQSTAIAGSESRSIGPLIKKISKLKINHDFVELANQILPPVLVGLVDPASIKLRTSAEITVIDDEVKEIIPTRENLRDAAIENALSMAFTVSVVDVHKNIVRLLGPSDNLNTKNITAYDVPSLLTLCFALEAGSSGLMKNSDTPLVIKELPESEVVKNRFIECKAFMLSKVETDV